MHSTTDKDTILLPIDFSALTPAAIAHAVNYSKILNTTLTLAHFLDKKLVNDANEVIIQHEEAISKLENLA